MTCDRCQGTRWLDGIERHQIVVGKHRFTGELSAKVCANCYNSFVASDVLHDFEHAVAMRLISAGNRTGPALKSLRKSAGFRNIDLAELLGVRVETLSRWETGKTPVDRATWVIVASLVDPDTREQIRQRLRSAAHPRKVGGVEKIAVNLPSVG